jgi:DNA-binding LacI/PurR family transcriptional regulator
VTIALIAEEAGVSIPTVSKVINGRPEVAPATRHRVERLLQEHGYQRRISQDDTPAGLVDLVFAEIESPWAMEIVRGAEGAAHEAGASVVISVLHAGPTVW